MKRGERHGPSRRDFLVMGAGVFAVSTLGVGLSRRRLVRRSVPVMGTVAELVVVMRDERSAQRALDAAVAELRGVDTLMSRFTTTSDIGRANAGAFAAPVGVSAATAVAVREALRWAGIEGSAFDPATGRAVELWDVTRRTAPPDQRVVERLANRALHRSVGVDRYRGADAIIFEDADVALDLGGIAKGYAVDRAVAALREWGVTDGLVNAGGDLYALGSAEDGEAWVVGVRAPQTEVGADGVPRARLAGTFALRDGAVATSGDYEQYFEHGGRRYHHLLDPRTAAPRLATVHSLTITAATCMAADAAATAVFGLEPDAAARVLARGAPEAAIVT